MKIGKQTFLFNNVYLRSTSSIVGTNEGEGPLGKYFDKVLSDDVFGEKSFEKAERKMFKNALELACEKAELSSTELDAMFGGDLLNQIVSASFSARDMQIPFFGVYGACSTICESILLASCLVDGGFAKNIACGASSHFSTAERQYRFPLEYGSQQTPTTQRTVTGAGGCIVSDCCSDIRICAGTVGKIIDLGVKDANNMGAAMAPAAADTMAAYFADCNSKPSDYDLILTGDLGELGKKLLIELMKQKGYEVEPNYDDCGCMIFYQDQVAPMGASGCGCATTVFNSYVYNCMKLGKYKNVLLLATGAMLSPITSFQGESIPGISYLLNFRRC